MTSDSFPLNLLYALLRTLAGKAFGDPAFHPKTLLKAFFFQKMLRINGKVPWPVHPTSVFKSPENIKRGSRCPGLSPYGYFDARNGIEIGENTWIGPGVSIISMNHSLQDYHQYVPSTPVIVGRNCWLGANAILLPGVVLGNHVVVGAGSVVTKSFRDDNIVIAGNPAKVVKKTDPYKFPAS